MPPGGKPGAEYDPQTDTWTPLPSLGLSKYVYNSADCYGWTGDRLMIFDVNGPTGVAWLPAAATWETFDPAPGEAYPVWNLSGCIGIPGGLVFVGAAENEKPVEKVWIRWQTGTAWKPVSFPNWFTLHSEGAIAWTGKFIAIWGGFGSDGTQAIPASDGALYDPATETWLPMSQLSAPSGRGQTAAVVQNGFFYAIGGGDGPATVNETFADGGRLLLPP